MGVSRFQLIVCLIITCYHSDTLVQGEQTEAARTALANIKLVGEEVTDARVFLEVEFTAYHCFSPPVCEDSGYRVDVYDYTYKYSTSGSVRGIRGEILSLKTHSALPLQTESYDYHVRVCALIGRGKELCSEYLTINRKAAGLIQTVEGILLTSARLSWVVPSSVAYFTVSWESTDDLLCNGLFIKQEASQNISNSTYTLKGLSPETSWKVSVSSFSESTKKTFISILHFSTKGVVFDSVTDTAVRVSFATTACSKSDGIKSYTLNVGRKSYIRTCPYGKVCTVNVSGLEPLTKYSVNITSAEGEVPLYATATFATTGDARPLNVYVTADNSLTWESPYTTEDVSADGLAYEVSCTTEAGEAEKGTMSLVGIPFPLVHYGVFYKCSFLMARDTVKARISYEYARWAVSKAVDATFGLPQSGTSTQYINGTRLMTVEIPQLAQEGVSVSFYTVTVTPAPHRLRDDEKRPPSDEGSCRTGTMTYIAVQLRQQDMSPSTTVTIGDGTTTNGIYNRPLSNACKVNIRLTVTDMRGITIFSDVYNGSSVVTGANTSTKGKAIDISSGRSVVTWANTSTKGKAIDISPAVIAIIVIVSVFLLSMAFTVVIFWKNRHEASTQVPQEEMELPTRNTSSSNISEREYLTQPCKK